jgi:hypothetical protein
MAMLPLQPPYTMIVSGQTGSGKTQFVAQMLRKQSHMHAIPFERILLVYSMEQPLYDELFEQVPNLELLTSLPTDLELNGAPTLLILDDLMLEMQDDQRLARLFTRMRHNNLSTIFITQNLYFQSRYATTVTRNAQYLVLFPNLRDASIIATLGRQIFPKHPKFLLSAFEDATSVPFGYLFIDLKSASDPKLRVRSKIFSEEELTVYRPT